MLTWTFPVLIRGRWNWVSHTCNYGNKYEAVVEYSRAQAERGVTVQGYDMSQAWMKWN